MAVDRRAFLKAAGLAAVGAAAAPAAKILAEEHGDEHAVDQVAHDAALKIKKTADVHDAASYKDPKTAKRWAMVVDIKKCIKDHGCTKCIDACHSEHNVPKFDNRKDEVKWIWKESFHRSFHEQEMEYIKEDLEHAEIPLLCNHCDNPPCTKVCPTEATFKRESDGLVLMDWHRCIGCRYCVVACPYGSRSFNWRDPRPHIDEINPDYPTRMRGVVEKCTFCEARLARGLEPACVEACDNGVLVFGDLEDPDSEVRKLLAENFTIRRKSSLGTHPEVYYIV